MCGIVGITKRNKDEVKTSKTILEMFDKQKNRGTQGFGYVSFDDTVTMYTRRQTREEIEEVLDKNESRSVMFHHRIPTSTPNYADCAHPIKVSHDELKHDYYLVHNGMISNCTILYDEYTKLGYEYITKIVNQIKTQNMVRERIEFNDSESLAIDVARYIELKQKSIKSHGSIAFIMMQVDKKSKEVKNIYFGRNSSPLTMKLDANELVLRSEGEDIVVLPNMLYCLNIKKWKLTTKQVDIGEVISVKYHGSHNLYGSNYDYEDDAEYGQTRTMGFLPQPKSSKHDDYEDMVIDEWSKTEADKMLQAIELKEEELGMLDDDLEYYSSNGYTVFTEEVREKRDKCADELEKMEIEYDLIMDGTFSSKA